MATSSQGKSFVNLFRDSAPYINAFRGRTFVIVFGGEAVLDDQFASLIHDFVLQGRKASRPVASSPPTWADALENGYRHAFRTTRARTGFRSTYRIARQ